MKHKAWALAVSVGLLASGGTARATLIDRGGGLIYDDVLNLTWLSDANYAKTSGYSSDGLMSWIEATTWAANLVYHDSVRNQDLTGWRLPTATDNGTPGCNYGFSGTDCGYNVAINSSEMAHLWYGDFANKAYLDTNGLPQTGWGMLDDPSNPADESLFLNIQSDAYWFGTANAALPSTEAWYLKPLGGFQGTYLRSYAFYAWAVRDGDVGAGNGGGSVPEPGTLMLAALGIGALRLARRRQGIPS